MSPSTSIFFMIRQASENDLRICIWLNCNMYVYIYIVWLWRGNCLLTRCWKFPLSHLEPLFKKSMYVYTDTYKTDTCFYSTTLHTPTRVLPWSQHVKWSRSSCQVQISRPSAGVDGGSGIRLGGILIRVPCITLVKRPFAGLKEHKVKCTLFTSSPILQDSTPNLYIYINSIIYF